MAKLLDSKDAVGRLLTIIAVFLTIIAFSSVYYLESVSRVSLTAQANANSNALSGYFLAASAARSAALQPSVSSTPAPVANSNQSGPDIITMLPADATVKQGQVVVFKVKTQNLGDRNANPSRTRVAFPLGDKVFNVPALSPGSFVYNDFAFQCPAGTPGRVEVYSGGDFYGQVTETNESNNNDMMAVSCVANGNSTNSTKPDLVSRFPDAVNGTFYGRVGSNVTLRELTKNIGSAYAKPSKTKTAAGGASFLFNKPGLGVGQSKADLFSFACVRAGDVQLSTTADYDFKVSESNENNNGERAVLKCA